MKDKELLSILLTSIRGLSDISKNPALSGSKIGNLTAFLEILADVITEGADQYEDLKIFTEMVERMNIEGRGPTPQEIDILRERKQGAHDRLQAVKAQLQEP